MFDILFCSRHFELLYNDAYAGEWGEKRKTFCHAWQNKSFVMINKSFVTIIKVLSWHLWATVLSNCPALFYIWRLPPYFYIWLEQIISGLFNEIPWFTKPSRDYLSTILGLFRRETIVNKQSMDYLTNNPRFSKPSIDYL